MRMICMLIAISVTMFTTFTEAAHLHFGAKESIHRIQDVAFKGPDDEDLYLGHRTKMIFIVAGVYLIDHGYVLAIKNDSKHRYYPLNKEAITSLQADRLLPVPLPKYTISLIEYLIGFSLWIIIVSVGLYVGICWYFERRKLRAMLRTSADTPAYFLSDLFFLRASADIPAYSLNDFSLPNKIFENKDS